MCQKMQTLRRTLGQGLWLTDMRTFKQGTCSKLWQHTKRRLHLLQYERVWDGIGEYMRVQKVHWGDKFQIQEHGLAAAATFLLARSAPLMEEAMAMAEAAIDAGPFCSTLFLSICSIFFSHLRPSSAGPFPSRSASFLASRGFANCVWYRLVMFLPNVTRRHPRNRPKPLN